MPELNFTPYYLIIGLLMDSSLTPYIKKKESDLLLQSLWTNKYSLRNCRTNLYTLSIYG